MRGKVAIATELSVLSVIGQYDKFQTALGTTLRRNKVQLASNAPYSLVVLNVQETSDDRVTVAALEYYEKLFSSVTVRLETADNIILFSPKEFRLKRHITGQENQLNSAMVLKDNTFQTMRIELIMQIIHWLSGIGNEKLRLVEKAARSSKKQLNRST